MSRATRNNNRFIIKTHNGHSPQQREKKKQVDLELTILKDILSQSTPLIPEIEKAFNASKITTGMNQRNQFAYKYKTSQDYISNLKLDV